MKLGFVFTATLTLFCLAATNLYSQKARPRDMGITIGVMSPGKYNAITDVEGVRVGHSTIIRGDSVRTGVTAIIPAEGNIFQNKIPAAIYAGNGFGKLAGYTQVKELGNLETPIVLTNTLAVGTAMNAVIKYTLALPGNENVQSVNALVGETNDSWAERYQRISCKRIRCTGSPSKCRHRKSGGGKCGCRYRYHVLRI